VLNWCYCRVNIPCAELYIWRGDWLCRMGGSVRRALLHGLYAVCCAVYIGLYGGSSGCVGREELLD